MNAPHQKRTSPERIGQVALLRARVAAAESNWKQAKEHLSQAKRRRKLARLMAKRAKRDAKEAKANLAAVREALVQAEARAVVEARELRSKAGKSKPAVKPVTGPARKPAARRRVRRTAPRPPVAVEQIPAPAPVESAVPESDNSQTAASTVETPAVP